MTEIIMTIIFFLISLIVIIVGTIIMVSICDELFGDSEWKQDKK